MGVCQSNTAALEGKISSLEISLEAEKVIREKAIGEKTRELQEKASCLETQVELEKSKVASLERIVYALRGEKVYELNEQIRGLEKEINKFKPLVEALYDYRKAPGGTEPPQMLKDAGFPRLFTYSEDGRTKYYTLKERDATIDQLIVSWRDSILDPKQKELDWTE